MDDGKCLLDVISDPQALKEFFRSTSQIAFVDGDASPVKQENVDRQQNKNTIIPDVIKNDTLGHSSVNQVTNIHTSKSGPISGSLFSQQQTKPLGHFPSSNVSDLNKRSSTFTSYVSSPSKNGLQPGNISSSTVLAGVPYSVQSGLGASTLNSSLNKTNPISNLQNTVSSIQTVPSVTLGKERLSLPRTSYGNTPISFALGDANKARNLLSGGTQVVSSLEKSASTVPKPHAGQQILTHPAQLKTSPSKLISNMVPGIGSPNRTTIVKGSVLPPLRPKKIIPRPLPSQNVATGISGEQHNVQIGIQSNLLTQGVKGKVVATTKGQPLIAIQPKRLITSQGGISSSLANQNALNLAKPNQSLAGNFTIGPKVQTQNQVYNSLLVQPKKSSIQSGNQVAQSNVPLTNLIQLQPKQIAPKPQDHSVSFPVPAKQKLSQEQVQIQQQLVQSLLAQSQQFAGQANVSLVVKNEPQNNGGDKESVAQQQNHLKELLQRTQMLQQVMQVRRIQQQQQQQQKIPPVTNVQVNTTAAPSQLETNQTSALQSLINSSLVRQGQPKLQHSAVQQTTPVTPPPTLVSQTKNTFNTKQLQEFLVKNPVLAQQLKQLNLKQANTSGNVNTTTATTSVKNAVQLQKTVKPTVTSQIAAPVTKKLVVASSGVQPQSLVISQAQRSEQKATTAAPQKVLIVQQSNSGAASTVGQPRVLLQTKEGRPILLSQEQFRQIQQQLAAKNLNLQGKLVTTTTTTKSQVVLKANDASSAKAIPKVTTTTTTVQVKQDVTKGVKRPVKTVESEESKLIKRMKGVLQKDQNSVSTIGLHLPFKSHEDAVKSLVPFHVFSEPDPNEKMQQKANTLLDKLALQLTNKSDRMINKYRHLMLGDLQRDVPSAELVMINRIFLADEKLALMKEKKMVLEEAKNMAKSIAANSNAVKQENSLATAAITPASSDANNDMGMNKNEMQLFPTSSMVFGEELSSQVNTNEQQIDIMDSSPSPLTSANSFLSDLSRTSSELSLTQSLRASNCTPEPS